MWEWILIFSIIFIVIIIIIILIVILTRNKNPSAPPSVPPPPTSSFLTMAPSPELGKKEVKLKEETPNSIQEEKTTNFIKMEKMEEGCRDCGQGFTCIPGQLLIDGQPYQNAIFDQNKYSITDVAFYNNFIYFILDGKYLAIKEPLRDTHIFQMKEGLKQLAIFNDRIIVRDSYQRLWELRGIDGSLNPINYLPSTEVYYLSATPDGNYIYINDTLYNKELQPVLRLDRRRRVFKDPNTYIQWEGERAELIMNGEIKIFPQPIIDASFTLGDDLHLIEAKNGDRFRRIRSYKDKAVGITKKICLRS